MTHDHDDTTRQSNSTYEPDFDAKAATWDDPGKVARARMVADAIVSATHPTSSTRVFEYGAGTGLVTEALGDRVGPATLADNSSGMREVMTTKVADGRLRGATVVDLDLDADDTPVPRRDFDLIITVLVLHHVTDTDRVLRRFAEMLSESGSLCIVDLDAEDGSFHGDGFHGHHGFERGALAHKLEAAGFTEVSTSDCGTITREDGEFSMFLAVARG